MYSSAFKIVLQLNNIPQLIYSAFSLILLAMLPRDWQKFPSVVLASDQKA